MAGEDGDSGARPLIPDVDGLVIAGGDDSRAGRGG